MRQGVRLGNLLRNCKNKIRKARGDEYWIVSPKEHSVEIYYKILTLRATSAVEIGLREIFDY